MKQMKGKQINNNDNKDKAKITNTTICNGNFPKNPPA